MEPSEKWTMFTAPVSGKYTVCDGLVTLHLDEKKTYSFSLKDGVVQICCHGDAEVSVPKTYEHFTKIIRKG